MIKEIYPLLSYKFKDGELDVKGPIGPTSSASEMRKSLDIKVKHLCRVIFNDDTMLQMKDGPGNDRTYYDHLAIVCPYNNTTVIMFYIDMGCTLLPIVLYYSDEDTISLTPIYKKTNSFLNAPTDKELLEMCRYIIANEEVYLSFNYKETLAAYIESKKL